MEELRNKKCKPCKAGTPPLTHTALQPYLLQITGWKVSEDRRIEKEYKFPDFKKALEFVNMIGEIAESEGHHPDVMLVWGKVGITLTTHNIKGLSENDFILAAKIDDAYSTFARH